MRTFWLLRMLFGILLSVSGSAKLHDMNGFVAVVSSYLVMPTFLLVPSAWLLTLGELGLAIWLFSGWRIREAALVLLALHLTYLVWLLVALVRGLDLPNCGCFGVYFARPLSWSSPIEDAVLIMLAFWLWQRASRVARQDCVPKPG